MKKLVAAVLTAVTAVVAGSAIALTPSHAQEIPPDEEAPLTTAPPSSSGTNLVVFVIPAGLGAAPDAACSLNGVAEESRAKPAMRVGNRDRDRLRASPEGGGRGGQQGTEADDDVGLPDEACHILRGLFVSLGGQVPQFEATDVDPDDAETGDDAAARLDDDDDPAADEDTGTLTPSTSRAAIFVTIFAGSDATTSGCTLGELISRTGASVPVVEAGGEVPLQGAADITDVALPADACALLSALFSTLANPPSDADDEAPETDDDAGSRAADDDEADADDEDSTPRATATARTDGTPSAMPAPSATTPPSARSSLDSAEDDDSSAIDEDEEPLGDEEGDAEP